MFGVNHKFAVNADEYDVNNPNRHLILGATGDTVATGGRYQTTVPKPFNLSHNE